MSKSFLKARENLLLKASTDLAAIFKDEGERLLKLAKLAFSLPLSSLFRCHLTTGRLCMKEGSLTTPTVSCPQWNHGTRPWPRGLFSSTQSITVLSPNAAAFLSSVDASSDVAESKG